MLLRTKDELMEEREMVKEAIQRYNVRRDTYCRWTVEFEMIRSMSGGKGQALGDPEMVPALKLV